MKLGLIGCGNLGESFLKGLLEIDEIKADKIIASDLDNERRERVEALGVKSTQKNKEVPKQTDVIFLAVKPGKVPAVLKELDLDDEKLLISLAAGISLQTLEKNTDARIIRVMPNICGSVSEMAAAFTPGSNSTPKDVEMLKRILNGMGTAVEVEEEKMDTVTGLSGSGPAYIFSIIKSLVEAGKSEGLDESHALTLSIQTVKGSAELAKRSELSLKELMDMVCSPNGTTIEGMKVLEEYKINEALNEAVKAARKRSKELSK
ncbi:MAG: pyrroline-5-carboxylate reductase [Candidatus Hadarchaeia archaeon]